MRMGRQTMRRADHVEYTDYEDEKEKAAPIRQQRSVHPQQPHRWARSPTTSTSTRVASFIVSIMFKSDVPMFFQIKLHFIAMKLITSLFRIDETAPMLNNLLNCINESVIDIGKCGLVILKYKQSGRFDEKIYNVLKMQPSVRHNNNFQESAKSLSAFELHTLSDGTCLGNLSSQVFHYGQIFYMKILQLRQNRSATRSTAVKTPKAPASLSASPNFVHVTRVFTGTYPFKIQEVVSTQEIGSIPADPRRAISLLIKHVLSQIFDGEKVHQKFAIRSHHGRNKKNDDLQDLPRDVLCFIKEQFGLSPVNFEHVF
ncbi:Protein CBG25279 [Caenorhabditis briggsae]|uniref:Protein CBG25279 n=1 Tax=Caenorhabditis briggsae TaxID=6238 RepID=B6IIJ7_CAEBR|nr:Protein CBG25279 [Caenorhabditis briggsae]CAR99727.1 Protein CBG25279 [Caenorhabditis briggsae]